MHTDTQEKSQLVPRFIRTCRRRRWRPKVADSTGAALTGGQLLLRTLVLRRLLRRQVLGPDERHVGLLLPPSVAAAVANMALTVDRRVSVNLNYTLSSDVLNACIQQAAIRHILTSRRFMEKMSFSVRARLVYLEDLRGAPTALDKLASAIQAYLVPAGCLARMLGAHKTGAGELLTIVFTSGSTGEPKGVMLTHANITHNVEAAEQVIHITSRDVLVGILPFFHSFGYTISFWTMMCIDAKGVYHFNPLDARQVGKLCREHGGTILLATATFLRTYLRRCEPEDFQSLEVVVAGAEKLPQDVSDAFERRFGVRPVEGYGTTELSPLVSVNIPPTRSTSGSRIELKEGTVGRPVPGVAAKVVSLETGEELGPNETGMLLVTGPNVMKGYLGREDLTREVMRDGWYVTGDIARIDDDGFIEITGRESRFSKIGGEMVPHVTIEEILAQLTGATEDGSLRAAVTAVPDEKKGERLVVVHTPIEQTPEELCKGLSEAGLPNLFIPSPDSFIQVEQLPILGSGKLDLKGIRQLAMERFGPRH